jgi:hypothetical protein
MTHVRIAQTGRRARILEHFLLAGARDDGHILRRSGARQPRVGQQRKHHHLQPPTHQL